MGRAVIDPAVAAMVGETIVVYVSLSIDAVRELM